MATVVAAGAQRFAHGRSAPSAETKAGQHVAGVGPQARGLGHASTRGTRLVVLRIGVLAYVACASVEAPGSTGFALDVETCYGAYIADATFFIEMSGARTTLNLGDSADRRALQDFVGHFWQNLPASLQGGTGWTDDEIVEMMFGQANGMYWACKTNGGRFWTTEVDTHGRVPSLPSILRSSLCVPCICSASEVMHEVLPPYISLAFRDTGEQQAAVIKCLESGPCTGIAEEHTDWAAFHIDFAIVGCECCGSTSLHMNLMNHPEIGFTTAYEDGFFVPGGMPVSFEYWGKHKVLPLVEQAERFNTRWTGGGPRPRLLGLNNPKIYHDVVGAKALAEIRGVKVIVIVCDPLDHFEKLWYYHHCEYDGSGVCEHPVSHALRDGGPPQEFLMAADLKRVLRLFGGQMALVHQQHLREMPRQTFDYLASFLGARTPFPPEATFGRYNSVGGQRTGLCSNASLVRAFKRRLEPEYKRLEDLFTAVGQGVPSDVLRRKTRCDRHEELSPSYKSCDFKARCQSSEAS